MRDLYPNFHYTVVIISKHIFYYMMQTSNQLRIVWLQVMVWTILIQYLIIIIYSIFAELASKELVLSIIANRNGVITTKLCLYLHDDQNFVLQRRIKNVSCSSIATWLGSAYHYLLDMLSLTVILYWTQIADICVPSALKMDININIR